MKLEIKINVFHRQAGMDETRGMIRTLADILLKLETLMTTVAELNAKLDAQDAAIAAERQEVLDELTALKALVAAASPASQADLDAIGARLDAQIAKTQGIITDADK